MAKAHATLNTYVNGVWLLCDAYLHYCDEGGALSPQQWNTIVHEQLAAL